LEKLYAYASWLARLLPNREEPPDIEITEDMLRLQAFRVEQKEEGSASVIFVTTQNGAISTINHDRQTAIWP
jgi:type I restriction enzyme R subunit